MNNLAGAQPTVVGIAEAKMNDLRRGAIRGERQVCIEVFFQWDLFLLCFFLVPFSILLSFLAPRDLCL